MLITSDEFVQTRSRSVFQEKHIDKIAFHDRTILIGYFSPNAAMEKWTTLVIRPAPGPSFIGRTLGTMCRILPLRKPHPSTGTRKRNRWILERIMQEPLLNQHHFYKLNRARAAPDLCCSGCYLVTCGCRSPSHRTHESSNAHRTRIGGQMGETLLHSTCDYRMPAASSNRCDF